MEDGNAHWNVQFEKDLCDLINRAGVDNKVGFPDYLLARFLTHTLWAFDTNLQIQRDKWPDAKPNMVILVED